MHAAVLRYFEAVAEAGSIRVPRNGFTSRLPPSTDRS